MSQNFDGFFSGVILVFVTVRLRLSDFRRILYNLQDPRVVMGERENLVSLEIQDDG